MGELFRNVLNAGFQGGMIIAAVSLARLVLKKVPKKFICLLWILAGLRLLLPFSFESRLSLQPKDEIVTRHQWQQLQDYGRVLPEGMPIDMGTEAAPDLSPAPGFKDESRTEPEVGYKINWALTAPWLWLAGACGMILYSVISYCRIKRRVREAVHLFGSVYECSGIGTAFLLGFLKPRIYVPANLSERSLEFILKHEEAHLRRFDHWVKAAGFLALSIHWFNPLVWLGYVLLCRDMEMACDEAVIRDMDLPERKAYSSALLACSAERAALPACPVAFGEVSVKQRILGVLNYRKKSFWLSLSGAAAIVIVALCFLTNPVKTPSEQWKAECRAVLDAIQQKDHYAIFEQRHFEGESILNDSADISYFRSEDFWQRLVYIDDIGENGEWTGYMGLNGRYFDSVGSLPMFFWREVDMTADAIFDPWLYSFDTDAQKVTANARKETGEGYEIRLLIDAPYSPADQGLQFGSSYYVDFLFDREGNFRKAVLHASGKDEFMGQSVEHSISMTMYAEELAESDILATMQRYAGELENEFDIYLGTATLTENTADWNLTLKAKDATSTGAVLVCHYDGGSYPGDLMTGRHYWIERWDDETGWTAVETVSDPLWFTDAQIIPRGSGAQWKLDWTDIYGELPAGSYRVCKTFSSVPVRIVGVEFSINEQEVDQTCHAPFEIS